MNIFILDTDPIVAAQMQCDKHVVKMVLETAQMLCSPFPDGKAPYKRTHFNHPCSVWARASKQNYEWLLNHGVALSQEYTYRYSKVHKCHEIILQCAKMFITLNLPDNVLTPFPQAMPELYRSTDTVNAYRAYYVGDKAKFAKWNKTRSAPDWYVNQCICNSQ